MRIFCYNRVMKSINGQILDDMAARLESLGNPTRLAIFRTLVKAGDDGANVGAIQDALGIPGSTLTHHIQKLVNAGLVSQERKSRQLICKANYDAMNEIVDYLKEECCQGLDMLQRKIDQL